MLTNTKARLIGERHEALFDGGWGMNDDGIGGGIPAAYRILEHLVPLRIPGFPEDYARGALTLAPEAVNCQDWYQSFHERLRRAINQKQYLPVCRLSDGEYRILFGEQTPSTRHPIVPYMKHWLHYFYQMSRAQVFGFSGRTVGGVVAGRYSRPELRRLRERLYQGLREVLQSGVVAAHLSFGAKPFQEQFHPALGRWLEAQQLALTLQNYVPFYFLYALLTSPEGRELLAGRRLGVVHSAEGEKRARITRSLQALGVNVLTWHAISPERSAAETLSGDLFPDGVDCVLLGAGVGKLALFPQLRHLHCPIIDAGYLFEVWAGKPASRPFMHSN